MRSVEERNALVLANLGLAGAVVRELWSRPQVRRMGADDALQTATVGLLHAAESWDAARGPFAVYAYHVARRHVHCQSLRTALISVPVDIFNEGYKRVRRREEYRVLASKAQQMGSLRHAPVRAAPECWQPEDLLDILPERQRRWLQRWLDGELCRQIAASEGRTRQTVSYEIRKALQRLRQELQAEG